MNRHKIKPRNYLNNILLESHDLKSFRSWKENCFYSLSYKEYNFIEKTALEVNEILDYYYRYIIDKELLESLNLLNETEKIQNSFSNGSSNVIERLDFYFDGKNMLLYDINCDFYNCLYETTEIVAQWQRVQSKGNSVMIVNNVRRDIQKYFEQNNINNIDIVGEIDNPERYNFAKYLYSILLSCGIKTSMLHTNSTKIENNYLIDIKHNKRINNVYKVFSWDKAQSINTDFLVNNYHVDVLEPYHIMVKENKGLLAYINLYVRSLPIVPTSYLPNKTMTISKPLNSHSGNKIQIHTKSEDKKIDRRKEKIYQNYYPPFKTEDNTYVILECWMINKKLSAIGFRESSNLITCSGNGYIVPYLIY